MADVDGTLKAMNCTNCGGSLPVLGGHRVKSVICSYCGAMMDRHDDLKILEQYRDMPRPAGPLKLGMTGVLQSVEQTVIGIVGVSSHIEGETYRWTDYQLFSPTHGYSWLTWNNGHAVHSRKLRGDLPTMKGRYRAERFDALDRTFRFFERYTAQITFLEGELTWVARLGDTFEAAEGISPPYGLGTGRSSDEIEHELQTYIDREEVVEAFGISEMLAPTDSVHPIQPFKAPLHAFTGKMAAGFAAVCLVLAAVLGFLTDGQTVADGVTDRETGALTLTFESGSSSALTEFEAIPVGRMTKSYEFFNTELIHAEKGSQRKFRLIARNDPSYRFEALRIAEPGSYTLNVLGVPYYTGDPMPPPVRIVVRQGAFTVAPIVWLAGLFGLIALSYFVRRFLFSSKRWKG